MSVIPSALAFGNLGTGDLILIAFIFVMLFGSKKLPELFRAMGQSVKEFKKAANDVEDNFRSAMQEEERKKVAAPSQPAATPSQSEPKA